MGSVEIQAASLPPGAREPGIQLPLLLGVCPATVTATVTATAEVLGPGLVPCFLLVCVRGGVLQPGRRNSVFYPVK